MNIPSLVASTPPASSPKPYQSPIASPNAAPDTAPAEPTAWSQNAGRFKELLAVALDTSGTSNLDARLKAHQTAMGMVAQGQLRGMDSEGVALYNQLTGSDLMQRQESIRQGLLNAVIPAADRGEMTSLASYNYFAGLSEDDQKILFELNINFIDMSGSQKYASLEAYKAQSFKSVEEEVEWRLNNPERSQTPQAQLEKALDMLKAFNSDDHQTLTQQLLALFKGQDVSRDTTTNKVAERSEPPASNSAASPGLLVDLAV